MKALNHVIGRIHDKKIQNGDKSMETSNKSKHETVRRKVPRARSPRGRRAWITIARRYRARRRQLKRNKRKKLTPKQALKFAQDHARLRRDPDIQPDPYYNSRLVTLVANRILNSGKKLISQRIVYETLKNLRNRTRKNELKVLKTAVENARPYFIAEKRKVNGKVRYIPEEVPWMRGISMSIRNIKKSAKKRYGRGMSTKLANELIAAYQRRGNPVRKRDRNHTDAISNRGFARFSRTMKYMMGFKPRGGRGSGRPRRSIKKKKKA